MIMNDERPVRRLASPLQNALDRMVIPRWFDEPMLAVLLPEQTAEERSRLLDELLELARIEFAPGKERFRVPERHRGELVQNWWSGSRREEFLAVSERLVEYCSERAKAAPNTNGRDEWRIEQLYHLVAVKPGRAMSLMKNWFDRAVEDKFDLNQGYRWLLPLEERRDWLAQLEAGRKPSPDWTGELDRLREYLSARYFWSEAWYKTINYLPRDYLKKELETFFTVSGKAQPWLLNLHAPSGRGKTATIDWLLARYAVPKGFVCARFDFDPLGTSERQDIFEQPEKLLITLSQNLNAQRSRKIEAFQRQDELRTDPIGAFTLVLRETYAERMLVIFIDTLEVLLDDAPDPGVALTRLLELFRRVREGDIGGGGSTPGYTNLRVVLSGKQPLGDQYAAQLQAALGATSAGRKKGTSLPILEVEIAGFSREEGREYLRDKRKLSDHESRLIDPILDQATKASASEQTNPVLGTLGEITPLKLALYADLVKEEPNITPETILKTNQIDLAYVVNRILKHIENPVLHWLLRYGVIFRRLDADAAQVLLPFLEKAQAGSDDLDNPDFDPEEIRGVLAQVRQPNAQPVGEIGTLLEQLTRYSWVSRQGDVVRFHPEVNRTLLQIIARQPIFKLLQEGAFQHFVSRAENTSAPQQKADYLREALYHGFQLGSAGAQYWREQFERFRSGPGPLLWVLVDEAFRVSLPQSQEILSENERYEAYLALASVLLAEKERPFLADQLEAAEDAARKAIEIARKAAIEAGLFFAHLITAKVALARRKLKVALEMANYCIEEATTPDQQVAALNILGQAEAANSLWSKAIGTLRQAYERSSDVLERVQWPHAFKGEARHEQIRLELIEQLLSSPNWHEAATLIEKARAARPGDPDVLALAARFALKQARLNEAVALFRMAATRSKGTQRDKLQEKQQEVELYLGQSLGQFGNEASHLSVMVAAAQANWPAMESALRARLASVSEAETLEVINLLLQFYLEVSEDWRQVKALLERGSRWVTLRPATSPAIARYNVLRQYVEFLNSVPILEPEAARQECERRLTQAAELQTPEERVRAKAYLLLVRFFGGLESDQPDGPVREAITIYTACAALALERSFEILQTLAPIDQVDILRTLAALPGWSSSVVNEIAPDPTERAPWRLLRRTFEGSPKRLPFLVNLTRQTKMNVQARLDALQAHISGSDSDWPLLYSSFARLLAAFGQNAAALAFLDNSPVVKKAEAEGLPILVAQDRAFIEEWEKSRLIIEQAIARLENLAEATSTVNELMLIWAYMGLDKGTTRPHWDSIAIWLSRLFALPFTNPGNYIFLQEYYLLQAIAAYKLDQLDKARFNLKQAIIVAEGVGNLYAIEAIKVARRELEAKLLLQAIRHDIFNDMAEPPTEFASPELLLILRQLDKAQIEVILTLSDQPEAVHRNVTRLQGIKKLLPQGRKLNGLPDMDYWQKLLNLDSAMGARIKKVGTTLLDDLLPPRHKGRKLLAEYLLPIAPGQLPAALRLDIQGYEVERVPWGILYDDESKRWLSRHFYFSRHRRPYTTFELKGASVAVRPLLDHPDHENIIKQVEILYSDIPPNGGEARAYQNQSSKIKNLYGPELLGQAGSDDLLDEEERRESAIALPQQVKVLHLLGDLSELNSVDGVFMTLGRSRADQPRERLTADALAHQLRQLGISRTLLILEPLSTGSAFEDVRVLMLRNTYAAALSQLGLWTVLAIGPRREKGFNQLLRHLLETDALSLDQLEALLLQARLETPPSSEDGRSLEGQYGLFYPAF